MASRVATAREAARRARAPGLAALEAWLRIPSVSGDPARRADLDRSARWVADRLRRVTPSVRTVASRDGPTVLACTQASPRAASRRHRPAVVVYGHLDVKPAGPGWTTPPFEPTRRGRRLAARGASDDKGQLLAHLLAVEAWTSVGGPPCDVAVIVDGAEEIGSPGLADVLASFSREHRLAGRVAAVLVSDTRAVGPGKPSVTVSQRGLVSLRVTVDVGGAPVHAGRFGGAVIDPSAVLIRSLAAAYDALPGPLPTRVARAALPTDATVRRTAAGRALVADRPAARSSVESALTVTRLRAGDAPGTIPTTASAELDVRLPPLASPVAAGTRIANALAASGTPGVSVRVEPCGSVRGSVLEHPAAVWAAIDAACRAGFGTTPGLVASGGSIPAVAMLATAFGVSPILLGLGPADDHAHGPDEYLDLDDWWRGIDTSVVLLQGLTDLGTARIREHGTLGPETSAARHGYIGRGRDKGEAPMLGWGVEAPVRTSGVVDDKW